MNDLLAAADEYDYVPLLRELASRLGLPLPAALARLRLVADDRLAFPAAEVESAAASEASGTSMVLRTRLVGLLGAMGPMPYPYTELAAGRSHAGEPALAEFLGVLHRPLAGLLARAHVASRFWLQPDSVAAAGDGDEARGSDPTAAFARVLCALVGTLGCHGGAPRGLPRRLVVHYAGLLRRRPMPAASLVALVADYFALPVGLHQLAGGWVDLPADECCRLGDGGAALGSTALLGDRVFDPSREIELHIGPVGIDRFRSLLPGGATARELAAVIAFAVGPTQPFSYTVELAADDVPPPALAAAADAAGAAQRLGQALWLGADDRKRPFTSGPFRVAPS